MSHSTRTATTGRPRTAGFGRLLPLLALAVVGAMAAGCAGGPRPTFTFPVAGDYVEELTGQQNLPGVPAGGARSITVPSNYGCIWTANAA